MTDHLNDWIFHYNVHRKKWEAVKREFYTELFSKADSDNILRSSEINTLIYIIKRTNGNKEKIKNLIQ